MAKKKKREAPSLVCKFANGDGVPCGSSIAWIPGVSYPVNPGRIEILLYEEGSPRVEGVTIKGDHCWGRKREPGEDGRVVEIWTRHHCEFARVPGPVKQWGIDRSLGEREEEGG